MAASQLRLFRPPSLTWSHLCGKSWHSLPPRQPTLHFAHRRTSNDRFSSRHYSSSVFQKAKYKWVDGAEDLERYTKGGYHPVQIGDVYQHQYQIVDKLGYGGWSTVWLARDLQKEKYVTIKIAIADSHPHEVDVLRALDTEPQTQENLRIPRVLDEFRIEGPNGSHPCYTYPPALGSLRQCSFNRLFHLDVARALAYELTLAVADVHSRGYVHADIHLRNVLVRAPQSFDHLSIEEFQAEHGEPDAHLVERSDGSAPSSSVPPEAIVPLCLAENAEDLTITDARILLGDFGESFAPATESRLGRDCHTPLEYHPPEAHFEPDTPLSFPADIWSLATTIWKLLGMQSLFSSDFCTEDEVICQIVDVSGPLPSDWVKAWPARVKFFDEDGIPKADRYISPKLDQAFEECVQNFRRDDNMGVFSEEETAAILDMIGRMIKLRPEERTSVEEVLESKWMTMWARPEHKRSLLTSRNVL